MGSSPSAPTYKAWSDAIFDLETGFARGVSKNPSKNQSRAEPPTFPGRFTARAADILVVYLALQFNADLSDLGTASAPNRTRHLALGVGQSVDAPDGSSSRVLVSDTWNTKIIDELAPHSGDVVIPKHRYSGFFETDLDTVLRERGITSLIFTGCTTSVCVESTLRDAFYRDYRCLRHVAPKKLVAALDDRSN